MRLKVNSNVDSGPKANLYMYFGFMGHGTYGNFKKVSDLNSLEGISGK